MALTMGKPMMALAFVTLVFADLNISDWAERAQLDDTYLNPSGHSRCPSKCRNYFAGASSNDAVICQKQASGVGTAQENSEFGVACYPAYGCGRDMITCVDQAWTQALPDISDVQLACAGLDSLVSENPWSCGSADEGRPACQHDTPNNPVGKWLLADAELGCGWGSTYGGTYPGYDGNPTPFSSFFTVTSELECCLRAMSFEQSTWDEGGAALFFQLTGNQCRVDREKIIYANMDSSSGRSVKYQNTRCNTGRLFYRHAAGAADAANLHTGGRCVIDGGFKRLSLSTEPTVGPNLPQGEIFSMGAELPNHQCDPNGNSEGSCKGSLIMNTIADAEACCEQCRSLSWLPLMGGAVETDSNGVQLNPCVAWQIVEGRCRLTRKHYYDLHDSSSSYSIEASLKGSGPGNPDWMAWTRGCGTSVERCNYYSYIYYRELSDSNTHPAGVRSTGNATYRKVVASNITEFTENITLEVAARSVESRHDRRLSIYGETSGSATSGTDVGLVEVYDSSAFRTSGDYQIFDEESAPQPLCTSGLIGSESVSLTCGLGANGARSRRLQSRPQDVMLVFTAVGSGYDQVNFQAAMTLEEPSLDSEATQTTTLTLTTNGSESTTTKDEEPVENNTGRPHCFAATWLVFWFLCGIGAVL